MLWLETDEVLQSSQKIEIHSPGPSKDGSTYLQNNQSVIKQHDHPQFPVHDHAVLFQLSPGILHYSNKTSDDAYTVSA